MNCIAYDTVNFASGVTLKNWLLTFEYEKAESCHLRLLLEDLWGP